MEGRIASLASSSDSEVDGTPSSTVYTPPPAKKLRLCSAMQHPPPPLSSDRSSVSRRSSEQLSATDDTVQMNGADAHLNGSDQPAASEPSPAVKLMSRTDKDIIRLIGQHLQAIGLTYGLLTNECHAQSRNLSILGTFKELFLDRTSNLIML